MNIDFIRDFSRAMTQQFWDDLINRYTDVVLRLSTEYQIHPDTLVRYHSFGTKLDLLEKDFPGVRSRVLTGNLEIQLSHISPLLEMPKDQLRQMIENPRCKKLSAPREKQSKVKPESSRRKKTKIILQTAIKQTPEYDPDISFWSVGM